MPESFTPIASAEPPGYRRVWLAVREAGRTFAGVAVACNCAPTVVSDVARGKNSSPLHKRVRAFIVEATGQPEAWLFATPGQPASHADTQEDVSPAAA